MKLTSLIKLICAVTIKVTCKACGKKFDWNDQWPGGLKKCPYCGKLN
jgi:uncharacterized Zn-finger protein